jgi:hypothetical protein
MNIGNRDDDEEWQDWTVSVHSDTQQTVALGRDKLSDH